MSSEDRDRLVATAKTYLAEGDAIRFAELARPAVALDHAVSGRQRSRLGGDAVLPAGHRWPEWNGRPLSLVCVIDLTEVAEFDTGFTLPNAGFLSFFFEADEQQAWGFDPTHRDGWRVVFAGAGRGETRKAPVGSIVFNKVPLKPRQILTTPSSEEPAVASMLSNDREGLLALEEHLESWRDERPQHRIGGWPDLQQAPIWRECQFASSGLYVGDGSGYQDRRAGALSEGVSSWRLLAQIDTDEAAGWMWGDVGCL
ncbi:MAG: DUF1963 domain-containing protein [bacterium]|nr:DUF1963 domain-containing protein [bacterium]